MTQAPEGQPLEFELGPFEFKDLLVEQFPHPLQAIVMPILALKDGLVHLRGTALSIGANLALTAKHVLDQDADLDDVALLHVVPGPSEAQVHSTLLPVDHVTAHTQTDVAVLTLEPVRDSTTNAPLRLQSLRLGAAPPAKGERCAMFGYTHKEKMGDVDEVLTLRPRLHVSEGTVVDHYPAGVGISPSPCFQIDGRTDHQMSGGPILSMLDSTTDLLAVRGIISTGYALAEGDPPLTFGAMTFTALALAPTIDRGATVEPTYLYDLARHDRIPVVDLDLVDFDVTDPQHPAIQLRAPEQP